MKRSHRRDEGQDARRGPHTGGYESNKLVVVVLEAAKREGHKILNDLQYEYIRQMVQRLEDFGNRKELCDLDIRSISTFWELREKGGVLGKINLRVYFGLMPEEGEVVIAMAYKKEEEDQVPRRVIVLVEDRIEGYRETRLEERVSVRKKSRGSR